MPKASSRPDSDSPAAVPACRRFERLKIAGHVAIQLILGFVIFFQANYLSCHRYARWDLTQNRKYTLSDTTRNFLSKNDSDVTLVMAFLGSSELYDDAKGLLSEYEHHGAGHVTVEVLDLSRNRQRLAALRDQQGLEFTRDSIAILSRDRKKVIAGEELVTRDRGTGRIVEFKGEEVLTSALLEVTEQQQKKVYLVMGKRRGEELQTIAKQFAELAATQNARLEMLSLEGAPQIPDDADAIVLAGNSQPLTEREMELLSHFWHDPDREKQGALLIFLDPANPDAALNSFLRTHGVGPEDDRVMTVASIPGMASRKISDVAVALMENPGVAPSLARLQSQLTGQTQSLAVESDSDLLKSENIHPRPLMITARNFWGETEYQREDIAFNEDQDHAWPIFTAASVEKGVPADANLQQPTSRLVVVSNPDLIDSKGNTAKVNADFALSALNWTLNREQLAGISPRRPAAYVLPIDPAQFSLLQSLIIMILPALALIGAGAVWFFRRA
ncbi:MAG: GldG family protein [Verrucomicrobiae bacterium]|nr:GldG family protein [Verrucomicrobiae bacterium]MCB1087029.1 GldG family protein [Verrucomicrobiae bacterium]